MNLTAEFKVTHPSFIGIKLIYAQSKVKTNDQITLYFNNFLRLREKFPQYVVGFDLVGQEVIYSTNWKAMHETQLYYVDTLFKRFHGRHHIHFISLVDTVYHETTLTKCQCDFFVLISFQDTAPRLFSYLQQFSKIPNPMKLYFLHAGETNWFGSVDENLVMAIFHR